MAETDVTKLVMIRSDHPAEEMLMPAKFPDRRSPPSDSTGGNRNVVKPYNPKEPMKHVHVLPSPLGPGIKRLSVDCDLPADVAEKIYRMLLQNL